MINQTKSRIDWRHLVAALFLVFLLVWSFIKIEQPAYRQPDGGDTLSFTPFNDYLILMAGSHFAEEGYFNNYLLANMSVGYPEFARGWYAYQTPLTDVPNARTYYTHYGPIDAIVTGLLLKTGISEIPTIYKIMTILSLAALALWYFLARRLFGGGIGLISLLIMGTSLVFLRFIDNISVYTYDILFAFGPALLFAWVETKQDVGGWKRRLVYAVVVLLAFLLMYNSPEFVPWLTVFFIGYLWVQNGRQVLKRWKTAAMLVAAPVLAQVVHFFQVAVALGSMKNAYIDFTAALTRRTTGFELAEEVGYRGFSVKDAIQQMNGDIWAVLRFELITMSMLLLVTWWLAERLKKYSPPDTPDKYTRQWRLLLVFFIAGVSFWFVMLQSTVTSAGAAYRSVLPFIGLGVGFAMVNLYRYLRLNSEQKLFKFITALLLVILIVPTVQDRLSGEPFRFEKHRQGMGMYYGVYPEEIKMLGDFLRENTNYSDVVVTDFRVAETGHPRYPFPGYEYHSGCRIEVARDVTQAVASLRALETIRASLPAQNPAGAVQFYLLFDEGSIGTDFEALARQVGELKAVFYEDDYWKGRYNAVPKPAGSSLPFPPRIFHLYAVDVEKLDDI